MDYGLEEDVRMGMRLYYLKKYDKFIEYDGTAEDLVKRIKEDEVVREDMEDEKLDRSIERLKYEDWMSCYREDTEGRRVKGGGGTEPTGKAKNSKALMARRENRWPGWREE